MNISERIAELEQALRLAKVERRIAAHTPRNEPGGKLYFSVGAAIRIARTASGMTQAELAAQVHVKRTSIVNIESGRQRLPLALLYDIADALSVQAILLLPRNEDV